MKVTACLLAAAALMITAQDATAKPKRKKGALVKPNACLTYKADPESKVVGPWRLLHRDDGRGWAGPWDIEIKADGSWTKDGKQSGFWCQSADMLILGYSDAPHTTYRGEIGANSIQGVESWDKGGTGIFEMTR